jgi:hypothetical protein
MADPAVDGSHEGKLHRPFDIAEQDDAVDIGRVLGAVNEGLVEHEGLPVAPNAIPLPPGAKRARSIDQ